MELGPLIEPEWWSIAAALTLIAALLLGAFFLGRWSGRR